MSDEPKKKAKAKRPTQRTLEMLRKDGAIAQVVERWQIIPGHPGGGVRQDLFGCIDVVAIIPPDTDIVKAAAESKARYDAECKVGLPFGLPWQATATLAGIQCGADSGHSGHKKKCLAEPRLKLWLEAGGLFFIHSWGKNGARGKVKHWQCRIEELTLADFDKEPSLLCERKSNDYRCDSCREDHNAAMRYSRAAKKTR